MSKLRVRKNLKRKTFVRIQLVGMLTAVATQQTHSGGGWMFAYESDYKRRHVGYEYVQPCLWGDGQNPYKAIWNAIPRYDLPKPLFPKDRVRFFMHMKERNKHGN